MAEVDAKLVKEFEDTGIKRKTLGDGSTVFWGPFLKHKDGTPVYFDNYTEALHRNIDARRNQIHKELGLNEQAQTPDQEKDFKTRQAAAKLKKQKAEILTAGLEQVK